MKWTRPPRGWKKCNIDGSFHKQMTKALAGGVIRDENGIYKGSAQTWGKRVQDALESELQEILMALQHCWSLGYDQIIIESDCQKAIDILNNKKLHFGYYNWIRDIRWWARKFQNFRFQWLRRNVNKVDDGETGWGRSKILILLLCTSIFTCSFACWSHIFNISDKIRC